MISCIFRLSNLAISIVLKRYFNYIIGIPFASQYIQIWWSNRGLIHVADGIWVNSIPVFSSIRSRSLHILSVFVQFLFPFSLYWKCITSNRRICKPSVYGLFSWFLNGHKNRQKIPKTTGRDYFDKRFFGTKYYVLVWSCIQIVLLLCLDYILGQLDS